MAAEVERDKVQPTLTSRDGTRLNWRAWPRESSKPAVVVAHGLGDHSGRYERLARALNRRDFSCYAVDLRGSGLSAGRRGHVSHWQRWVDDYTAFWELVENEASGQEMVPLGHSFGGVVVASALVRGAIAPQRFVLSNPAFRAASEAPAWKLRLGRAASGLLPALGMSNGVEPALISRDPQAVNAYREDPLVHDRISSRTFTEWVAASEESLERAGEITASLFLILSDQDRVVDPGGGREFAERLVGACTARSYRGRYHEPFNDLGAEEVFADLAAWLDRPPQVNGHG